MQKLILAAGLAAVAISVCACSSYGSSTPQPVPDNVVPPPEAITINILGMNGAQSFSPNPSSVPVGKTVVWHNLDGITHRVVLDDGELDTGNIGPGSYSAPMPLVAPGSYHCSIHPSMVGAITSNQ